jgi:hypothetical protein
MQDENPGKETLEDAGSQIWYLYTPVSDKTFMRASTLAPVLSFTTSLLTRYPTYRQQHSRSTASETRPPLIGFKPFYEPGVKAVA